MQLQPNIIFIVEIIGTIAFASSGAMVAVRKRLDLFGIIVLGVITAVGGGMLRDLMIGNIPPNMFRNPIYVLAAFLTVLVLFLLFRCWPFLLGSRYIEGYEKIMNILDAIGLGAFTVIGIDTGVEAGYGDYHFLIIFLGVITGIGGGILRDIMAGETPYVLKKHIYACASIAGACLYVVLLQVTRSDSAMIGSALLVVAIRILASHFRWDLPGIDMD
ncbi:trimeric intracellular cation channel family protein [Eisenbergiella porci]|uniref:trimeric intracellular cation channel family protein n=1 Tax=Eisenbergiella porci TaxID=2652274 RepID=UPI002A7EE431|nr:trimeric intracellular cation channel family protein [Eisenbergiella porci]